MEANLLKLKGDFNNIISIRTTVKNVFDILQVRINKLKDYYSEFIKTSKTQMFIFGLDSLHFQRKLIDIEYDDMKRLFLAINNRMYCEYFKLYKIIIEYILHGNHEKKITDLVKINNYPIYKDLEPFKEYNFEIISNIHEDILNLLSILLSTITNKENELLIHKGKQRIGLNIDNFITTFNYNINAIKEKIVLFTSYIEFFHKLHTTYLKRFANKIQLMYTHVNNDIHFDESVIINKQNSDDLTENTILESLTHSNRSIDSRSSVDSRKSTTSKSSTKIEFTNTSNFFDFNENSIDIQVNDDLFNSNIRSRTNSYVSSNTSNNSTIISRLTIKDILNPLSNTKEETKKIENTLSNEDLNNMFSSIDMTCNSLIEKNNNEPSPVLSLIEETILEPLVNPIISSYFEKKNNLLEPLNDETSINEIITNNENQDFNLMTDSKENYQTDNDKTDTITDSSEATNEEFTNKIDNNTQIGKKKRNKAKNKK